MGLKKKHLKKEVVDNIKQEMKNFYSQLFDFWYFLYLLKPIYFLETSLITKYLSILL